jgi:hypothetical protein
MNEMQAGQSIDLVVFGGKKRWLDSMMMGVHRPVESVSGGASGVQWMPVANCQ